MSCIGTCFSKGGSNSCTCKKHDGVGVAAWLCQSVAAAFFASLKWCSCVFVDTRDDGPEDDSNSAPLIPNGNAESDKDSSIVPNSWIYCMIQLQNLHISGTHVYWLNHQFYIVVNGVIHMFSPIMYTYGSIVSLPCSFNLKMVPRICVYYCKFYN